MIKLIFSDNRNITGWSTFEIPNDWYNGCCMRDEFPAIMRFGMSAVCPVNLDNKINIPHL